MYCVIVSSARNCSKLFFISSCDRLNIRSGEEAPPGALARPGHGFARAEMSFRARRTATELNGSPAVTVEEEEEEEEEEEGAVVVVVLGLEAPPEVARRRWLAEEDEEEEEEAAAATTLALSDKKRTKR